MNNRRLRLVNKMMMTVMALLMSVTLWAQDMPVHFTAQQKQVSPTEVDVIFSATIDKGWHVYSTGLPADGPISASITTEKAEGAEPMGGLIKQGKEITEDDKIFGMKVRYFENKVTFIQKYKITGKTYHIKGYLEYGACNDEMCMPPTSVDFDYSGKGPEEAPAPEAQPEEKKTDELNEGDDVSALLNAQASAAAIELYMLCLPPRASSLRYISLSDSSYRTTIFSPLRKAPCSTSFVWVKGSILAWMMILFRWSMVMASSESKMKQSSGRRFRVMRNLALTYSSML